MTDQPRRRRRRRHDTLPVKAILACLIAAAALVLILLYLSRSFAQKTNQDVQPSPTPVQTQEPATPFPSPTVAPTPDFSQSVPESAPVEENYLDDAVFIGDSRTEGLLLYTGLTNTTGYTYKGLMVDTAFTKPVINQNGQMVTVMDALRSTQFSKVYIMLGINELGWAYPDLFIEKYKEIIDTIREINPNAIIYVQEILPVTQKVSETHSYITNEKISQYNQMLADMTQEKDVYYLQVSQAVADSQGYLPEEAASDGIHLSPSYCQKWLDYLLCHTVSP